MTVGSDMLAAAMEAAAVTKCAKSTAVKRSSPYVSASTSHQHIHDIVIPQFLSFYFGSTQQSHTHLPASPIMESTRLFFLLLFFPLFKFIYLPQYLSFSFERRRRRRTPHHLIIPIPYVHRILYTRLGTGSKSLCPCSFNVFFLRLDRRL